ncbi:hypothetical protein H0X48_05885 [Candidatus Dependentiae bacterium]|nr:hypothetical protein [Candidatus Dependentiae bacterium]
MFLRCILTSLLLLSSTGRAQSLARFDKIISLGSDCEVATQLNKYKLRHEAYPFDWMRTFVFSKLTQLIQNNFANFLHTPFLVKTQHTVVNKHYLMAFVHDFPTLQNPSYQKNDQEFTGMIVPNFTQFVPQAQEKYARRIERFKAALHSNGSVLFIRSQYIQPADAAEFVQLISRLHPRLNFTLAVVSSHNHSAEQWHIPHVIAIQETRPLGKLWFSEDQWTDILRRLQLIQ